MIEFTLAAVVFFLLVFGVLDFGRAVYEYNTIASSAREGARAAIIQANTDADVVRRVVDSSARLVAPADVAIAGARRCVAPPCGRVTVTVARPYTPATPFVAAILGDMLVLRASSTMVVER